jgi:hypothetical protein
MPEITTNRNNFDVGANVSMRTTKSGGVQMTDTQFLTILGTIWIAPYVNKLVSQFTGLAFMLIVIFKILGWC